MGFKRKFQVIFLPSIRKGIWGVLESFWTQFGEKFDCSGVVGGISHPVHDCFICGWVKCGEGTTVINGSDPLVFVHDVICVSRALEVMGKRNLVVGMGGHCGCEKTDQSCNGEALPQCRKSSNSNLLIRI